MRVPLGSRRLAAIAAVCALVLAGCGSTVDPSTGPMTSAEAGTPAVSGTSSAATSVVAGPATDTFPVTIEHKFGSTTIPAEPQRVVVVGLTEQDILLELGVVPVATTEWYGDQPDAVWPWARELLGDAHPAVLKGTDGPPIEQIAALTPDLIVGTNAGLTQAQYDLLSKVAPTISSLPGSADYFSPWQDQTRQVARAVGRSAGGQALIDRVEKRYAEVKAAHPQFANKTAAFAQGAPYEGSLWVYPQGINTDFLTELGFTMSGGLEQFQAKAGQQAQVPAENVDLIDSDVVVFATESADQFGELQEWAPIGTLQAVQQDRTLYTDSTLAGAIYFLTPLSQMYVLDRLPAALDRALAGQAPRQFANAT